MKHLTLFFIIFLLLFLSGYLYSSDNYVFAPFVSRLKAVEDKSLIKLSWKDSGDIKGSCLIYRHTEKISRNNFTDSFLLAEVAEGVESYTDTAMAGTNFYYSVLVKNNDDKIFDIFIPYRNVTSKPVQISSIKKIEDNHTNITYLRVSEKKESLYITFKSSNPERNAAVLRSHSPIFSSDDLKKADLLSVISSGKESYSDFPIAGIPFYYSVVDAELLKSYKIDVIPFENSTVRPSEIKITEQIINDYSMTSRPEPLPALIIDRNLLTGKKISTSYSAFFPEQKLSSRTNKIISEIINNNQLNYKIEAEILNKEDFYNHKEDIGLTVILSKYFFKKDWENLKNRLKDYIRKNRNSSLEKKASFYLGQSYYFSGEYQKAYLEFLSISDSYYPESKRWMDNILLTKNRF